MASKQVLKLIRNMGLTANRTQHGEFRVNYPYPRGTEDTAYYTEDAEDALYTAAFMAREVV